MPFHDRIILQAKQHKHWLMPHLHFVTMLIQMYYNRFIAVSDFNTWSAVGDKLTIHFSPFTKLRLSFIPLPAHVNLSHNSCTSVDIFAHHQSLQPFQREPTPLDAHLVRRFRPGAPARTPRITVSSAGGGRATYKTGHHSAEPLHGVSRPAERGPPARQHPASIDGDADNAASDTGRGRKPGAAHRSNSTL